MYWYDLHGSIQVEQKVVNRLNDNMEHSMKQFMDENFLLQNDTAVTLYHKTAKALPIIDYHCHIQPKEIAEDRQFENITQLWLGGDHYKWRQMRSHGIDERFITGNATDKEKFFAWAETLEKLIGNPLYHWSHLELQRYFNCYKPLTRATAEELWNLCNREIQKPEFSTRNLMKKSNVELICTTDDPVDSLEWHKAIAEDSSFHISVRPTFRPDKAINIEKPEFLEYLQQLSEVSTISIDSFKNLVQALKNRIDYFDAHGCRISDHGLEYIMFEPASPKEIEVIFASRVAGKSITTTEVAQFKTACMIALARAYAEVNWTMQLHYGCVRNCNTPMFKALGADSGFDTINNYGSVTQMVDLFDALQQSNELPKTILYSLNPSDNAPISTLIGCFQSGGIRGKIQHGSAWWFNDHKQGMIDQMVQLANCGMLANFVGMLTDSRSFLSYPRHEYFRRILCNLIGSWVEDGEFPNDQALLEEIVTDISYGNAKRYFEFS